MSDSCPRKIVIFLPNWVGDVVMATPSLRAIRRHFAEAHITHFGRPAALETLGSTDWADDTLIAVPRVRSRTIGLLQVGGALRGGRFDLAVLLTNSFRTALLARLAGIGRIVGYSRDARGPLLTDRLHPPRDDGGRLTPVPAIDYYAELAGALGAAVDSRRMSLPVAAADEKAADDLLDSIGAGGGDPVVMLNPGASGGTSKMWDHGRFARAADMLIQRRGARIIIHAAPGEQAVARAVGEEMENDPAVNFGERTATLGMFKSLLKRADLLITNDTGARHVAAAMGTRVVTVFGSTDPDWARTDHPLECIVRADVPCSPCRKKLCSQPAGPKYHQCMEKITPEKVVAAAQRLLDRPVPGEVGA